MAADFREDLYGHNPKMLADLRAYCALLREHPDAMTPRTPPPEEAQQRAAELSPEQAAAAAEPFKAEPFTTSRRLSGRQEKPNPIPGFTPEKFAVKGAFNQILPRVLRGHQEELVGKRIDELLGDRHSRSKVPYMSPEFYTGPVRLRPRSRTRRRKPRSDISLPPAVRSAVVASGGVLPSPMTPAGEAADDPEHLGDLAAEDEPSSRPASRLDSSASDRRSRLRTQESSQSARKAPGSRPGSQATRSSSAKPPSRHRRPVGQVGPLSHVLDREKVNQINIQSILDMYPNPPSVEEQHKGRLLGNKAAPPADRASTMHERRTNCEFLANPRVNLLAPWDKTVLQARLELAIQNFGPEAFRQKQEVAEFGKAMSKAERRKANKAKRKAQKKEREAAAKLEAEQLAIGQQLVKDVDALHAERMHDNRAFYKKQQKEETKETEDAQDTDKALLAEYMAQTGVQSIAKHQRKKVVRQIREERARKVEAEKEAARHAQLAREREAAAQEKGKKLSEKVEKLHERRQEKNSEFYLAQRREQLEREKGDIVKLKEGRFQRTKRYAPTDLCDAALAGDTEQTHMLLKAGVSPNVFTKQEPLLMHMILLMLKLDAGEEQAPGERKRKQAGKGPTPFQPPDVVVHFDVEGVIDLLLEFGAKLDNLEPPGIGCGYAPIHYCVKRRNAKRIKWLHSRGANVDLRNDSGMSPLVMACRSGCLPVVIALLQCGADINASDAFGRTPLSHCVHARQPNLVKFMLHAGGNRDLADVQGRLPLEYAQEEGHREVIEALRMFQYVDVRTSGELMAYWQEIANKTAAQRAAAAAESDYGSDDSSVFTLSSFISGVSSLASSPSNSPVRKKKLFPF